MTKPRIPPLWLVLLPALVLAAVGVRAVTAEMRATDEAARDRARSIASRLARSMDGLVAEYAAPLPAPGTSLTRDEAKAATAHLQPRRAMTTDGVSLALDHGDLAGWPPVPAREAALVEDALKTAERLAREPHGNVAAAALAAATSRVVALPVSRARLAYAAAEYDPPASDAAREFQTLRIAVETGAFLRDTDGRPFDVRGLRLLAASLGPQATRPTTDLYWTLFDRIAEDPWGLPDDERSRLLDDAEQAAQRSIRAGNPALYDLEHRRLVWDTTRSMARGLRAGASVPSATFRSGGNGGLSVWADADVDGRRTLLGGDVSVQSQSRVRDEAQALAEEPQVVSVRLASAGGSSAFESPGTSASVRNGVVESVALAPPLSDWRAEAVVAPETGVPATAWMLAAALVLTTAALVAGSLALRRAAERSARLAEERRTFLDHVAHELRTPAAAVQALTEELASGHVPAEKETLYREHLLRESRRLSALVEDTLDFARLDAGRLAFRMEPADLRDVVRRAIEESDGAGRVVARLPETPVVRPLDAAAMRRAVRNLVENAVRHGGGDAPVGVTLEARNGHASVVVADQGRGIAAEHLPHLFERFYRVPSPTHEVKGVGLGLALVREVARAHGGDVGVESEVGKGSTFTLRIPRA